MICQEHSHT